MAKERPVVQDGDFSAANNGVDADRVWTSMAKTINLGDYESIRVEVGNGMALNGRDRKECYEECLAQTLQQLVEGIGLVQEAAGNKPKPAARSNGPLVRKR